MPIRNPADLHTALASGQRLLGFDVGEKTIGLPIGKYQVRIAKKSEPVEVQAGAITEF